MYNVFIIGTIILILYLLTLTGSSLGFIKKANHREFWNTGLLFTFLITAAAGVFLALQSNYKWNIKEIENLLHWHVEFGIAMSFTIIIHLTWNLRYYKKLIKRSNNYTDEQKVIITEIKKPELQLYLILLGFLSGTVQVILLREVLNLSGGYEIIAGAVFSCWILISALGAVTARNNTNLNLRKIILLLPFSVILSLILFVIMSVIILPEGVTPGFLNTLSITAVSFIPVCFISGYLFVKLSAQAAESGILLPGKTFALETAGGIIAGILITLLTGRFMGNFKLLFSAILIYLIACSVTGRIRYKIPMILALSALFAFNILSQSDLLIRDLLIRSINVTDSRDSKYGNIAIGDYSGETSVFYNHRLLDYEKDIRETEESVHLAMVQHDNPENVLLISGGLDSYAGEILKYPEVRCITYIERDPEIINIMTADEIASESADIEIINNDAFRYLHNNKTKYDVVISLVPAADNILMNRYFTNEFFELLSMNMSEEAILILKAGEPSGYLSQNESSFLSSVLVSLGSTFNNILPVKGFSIYLLASNDSINTSIPEMIESKGINTVYVNSNYLNESIIEFESDQILSSTDSTVQGNSLNKPFAVFFNQKHSMSKSGAGNMITVIILAAVLFIPFISFNSNVRTMYSTSLNLAGTEILILILIQSTAGNFYQLSGLLIALVMGGLAIGSSANFRLKETQTDLSPLALGLYALLLAWISILILNMGNTMLASILSLILVLFPAVVTGYYYKSKTCGSSFNKGISSIYSADLFGAAFGFLLIAGIFVPVMGLKTTFIILAIINFASYITNQVFRTKGTAQK